MTAVAGTRVAELCGTAPFTGFHWCNYGLAPEREAALVDAGLVVSARAPDAGVEAVELPGHPFYLATLFQPQVGSSTLRSAPPADRGADLSRGRDLTRLYAGRVPPASSRRTRSRESAKRTAS